MHPRIFGLAPFPIFLAIAVVVGTVVHLLLVRRAKLPVLRILALYAGIGMAMFAGARLFSLQLDGGSSASWIGSGVRYPGALLALAVALPVLGPLLARGTPLRLWGDLMVPGGAFAIAILRIDCLLEGCCAGAVSSLPWALRFPAGSNPWYAQVMGGLIRSDAAASLPVHPLQIYFLLLSLAVGVFALWWLPRKAYDGQVVLLALVLHESGKFLLEFLRAPRQPELQVVSLGVVLVAGGVLLAVRLGWTRPRARLEAA